MRAIEEYPKPSVPTVLIFGLGLGLAIGSRILAGMAALYMIVPLAMLIGVRCARNECAHGLREFRALRSRSCCPGLVLAYAIMALVWPWSVQEPLNPLRAVGYFSRILREALEGNVEGVPISVPDMPRSYIPVMFAIKMAEIFVVARGRPA